VKKYTNYAPGTLTAHFHLTTLRLRKPFTHCVNGKLRPVCQWFRSPLSGRIARRNSLHT